MKSIPRLLARLWPIPVLLLAILLTGCPAPGGGGPSPGGGQTLPAPAGLTATQNLYFDAILLRWNAVPGAATYQASRSPSASGPFIPIGWIAATAGANTTTAPSSFPITKGQHYFFKVAAVDSSSMVGTYSDPAEGWSNTYLFNDSFEDGNFTSYPSWGYRLGSGGSAWQITTSGADSTAFALSYTGGLSDGYWTQMSVGIRPSYISFWAKVSANTAANTGEFVCGDSSYYNLWSIRFYFYSDGKMYVQDYTDVLRGGVSYSANTWYHVELKNINWTTYTYDFYVNGVASYTGVTMYADAPVDIATVDLFNESSVQAMWDEIVMY